MGESGPGVLESVRVYVKRREFVCCCDERRRGIGGSRGLEHRNDDEQQQLRPEALRVANRRLFFEFASASCYKRSLGRPHSGWLHAAELAALFCSAQNKIRS